MEEKAYNGPILAPKEIVKKTLIPTLLFSDRCPKHSYFLRKPIGSNVCH